MGNEERDEDHGAVLAVKTGSRPHMILLGPIQSLDELLKRPPLF